jgi:hypothetical protein
MVSDLIINCADYLYKVGPEQVKEAIDYARQIPPETIKTVADYISSSVSALFSVSLLPQIIHGAKGEKHVHPHTSLSTAVGCYVLAANFGLLLGLHYTGLTNLVIASGWTTIYRQGKRYEKKKKLEELCIQEEAKSLPGE